MTTRYTGPSIFDRPSATGTIYDWVYQAMTSLLLHGNAWGLITGRDGYGYPTGIEWIPPDMVEVTDDPREPWNPMRTRVYVYGRLINDWRNELFHVKGYALPGRTEGLSPLRAFALTVMSGIEAARYGADWFSHGGFPSGVFKNEELEVDAEDARAIRESLIEAIRGHKPLVIGRDWDYKPVSVPPSEAQFLEACTTGAARLAMADGTQRRADEIVVGDKVLSWDDGLLVPACVEAAWPIAPRPTVRVTTEDRHQLETSLNHPYWALHANGDAAWVQAGELQQGDFARIEPGARWSRVVSVAPAGDQVTYGITIAGTHTHVTEGIVTHNTQMNATQLAAVFGLPPDRVGGARGDSLTYNCVDAATEILTTRGWLAFDQVREGDTALTLNTGTGLAEWQPVQSVHVFEDGPYPVTRMESSRHSSVSTPDHRWPVLPYQKTEWAWTDTAHLGTHHRVTAAAPVAAPQDAKWSDALVELIAWFWTEGWIGEHGQVTLTQSGAVNPGNVVRIREALTAMLGPDAKSLGYSLLGSRGWQKRQLIREELARDPQGTNRGIARACGSDAHTVRNVRQGLIGQHDGPGWTEDTDARGISHFRLNSQAGALLTEHAPGKVISVEFLSQLTRAQLELFYQVSIDADGTRRDDETGDVIAQRDRVRLDAFQVACALTGRAAVLRGPNSRSMWHMSVRVKPLVKPAGHAEYISQGTEPLVWCVQTPNRTWFARRNGTIYATGNTVEQSTLQVIEALRPWIVRLETAFFGLLPQNRFVRFNADALLKTDLKTRTDIYAQQRAIGLRSIDELRDLEDLPPLPGAAGGENIPLEVMVAIARSIRAIPNSMLKDITLEMDLAADRLAKLQPSGEAAPNVEPSAESPAKMLGSLITATRGLEGLDTEDVIRVLAELAERKRARRAAVEPEFIGPWIPSDQDLSRIAAMASAGNGNGNGRAH